MPANLLFRIFTFGLAIIYLLLDKTVATYRSIINPPIIFISPNNPAHFFHFSIRS